MQETPVRYALGKGRDAGGRSSNAPWTSFHVTGRSHSPFGQPAEGPGGVSRVPTAMQLLVPAQDKAASHTPPGRWIGMNRQNEPFHRSAINLPPAVPPANPRAVQN